MGQGGAQAGNSLSIVPAKTTNPDDHGSIIVYSWRVIPGGERNYKEYMAAAEAYGEHIKPPKIPGVKTYVFSRHPTKLPGDRTLVSDIQWFSSIGVFRAHMGLYGDMQTSMAMKKFVDKADQTEEFGHFKGYVFGGWNKNWVGPIHLTQMFPNFPPGKWFEFRDNAAGFIRNTEASTENPPIIVMIEHLVKEGFAEQFTQRYEEVANRVKDNQKVYAMYLTKEQNRVKLIDHDKLSQKRIKSSCLFVSFECYENFETFKEAAGYLRDLKPFLAGPSGGYMHPALSHTGEVWAEGHNREAEIVLKETYHPESWYFPLKIESGFSNHKTACDGRCPEVEVSESFKKEYMQAHSINEVVEDHLQHHVPHEQHDEVLNERKADAEKIPGDLMLKDQAHEIFHHVNVIAKEMGESVSFAVWNGEHEIMSGVTPGCNAFFIKTARGKIVSLMDHKDYSKMTTSYFSIAPQMAALAAGATNRFDVKGAILIKHEYPLGSGQQMFGCASVGGCSDAENSYKILHGALLKSGFKIGDDGIASHPPPAMAKIEDTIRFQYLMKRYQVDAQGAVAILEAKKGDADKVAADLHMKKAGAKCLSYAKKIAAEMKEKVALVIWHEDLEIFQGTVTEDTNCTFVSTARGKIIALSGHKDYKQMTASPFLVPGRAAAYLSGFSLGMSVMGAVMIKYEYPTGSGKQVVDYVSVSGCLDANNDLKICKHAVKELGLTEGADGVWTLPRGIKDFEALGVQVQRHEHDGGRCSDRCSNGCSTM